MMIKITRIQQKWREWLTEVIASVICYRDNGNKPTAVTVIDGLGISSENAHRWMKLDITDDKSTSVELMAWYR